VVSGRERGEVSSASSAVRSPARSSKDSWRPPDRSDIGGCGGGSVARARRGGGLGGGAAARGGQRRRRGRGVQGLGSEVDGGDGVR